MVWGIHVVCVTLAWYGVWLRHHLIGLANVRRCIGSVVMGTLLCVVVSVPSVVLHLVNVFVFGGVL